MTWEPGEFSISQGDFNAPVMVDGEVCRHWGINQFYMDGEVVLTHLPSGRAACKGYCWETMRLCAKALDSVCDMSRSYDELKDTSLVAILSAMALVGVEQNPVLGRNYFRKKNAA